MYTVLLQYTVPSIVYTRYSVHCVYIGHFFGVNDVKIYNLNNVIILNKKL